MNPWAGEAVIILRENGKTTQKLEPPSHTPYWTYEGPKGQVILIKESLDKDKTSGILLDPQGLPRSFQKVGRSVAYSEVRSLTPAPCGVEGPSLPPREPLPVREFQLKKAYRAPLAVTVDYELFELLGGTGQRVMDYVSDLMAQVNLVFARDLDLQLEIAFLEIFTTADVDPYANLELDPRDDRNNAILMVNRLMTLWGGNPEYESISRAMSLLLTGRVTGGRAHIGDLCNNQAAYGVAGFRTYLLGNQPNVSLLTLSPQTTPGLDLMRPDVMLTSHELGHLLGSGHTHCYRPEVDRCSTECFSWPGGLNIFPNDGTIMSYCQEPLRLAFHPRTIARIWPQLAKASCIGYESGENAAPLNFGFRTSGTLQVEKIITFDAIASDLDGDPLSYEWNFGDGQLGHGQQVTHIFHTTGEKFISLTVSDGKKIGVTDTSNFIRVAPSPTQPTSRARIAE